MSELSVLTARSPTMQQKSQSNPTENLLILSIGFSILNFALGVLPPFTFSGAIALSLFLLHVAAVCAIDAMAFVLLLPFIVGRLAMFISGALIEAGAYLEEIGVSGEPSGAFFWLNGYIAIFLAAAALTLNVFRERMRSEAVRYVERLQFSEWSSNVWIVLTLVLCVLFACYMIYVGVQSGFPILSGLNRSVYRHSLEDQIYNTFQGNRPILSIFLGLLTAASALMPKSRCRTSRLMKLVGIGGIIMVIIISVLFSEKFTSIVLNISYFSAPSIILQAMLNGASIWRIVGLMLLLAIITTPVVLIVYGALENAAEAWDQFASRAAASGQLWHVTLIEVTDAMRVDIDALHSEVALMASSQADDIGFQQYKGLYYFMLRYKPADLLNGYFAAEGTVSTFTYAFESYLLHLFGRAGMILPLCAYAAAYGCALGWLARSICAGSFLRCFVTMKLLIFYASGLASGNLWVLSGTKAIMAAALIFATELALKLYEVFSREFTGSRTCPRQQTAAAWSA